MRVLGIKRYIDSIYENVNNERITDIPTIEKCFADVAEHCKGDVLGFDRTDVLKHVNAVDKKYIMNLMKCDIPPQLTDSMKKSIDAIFKQYVYGLYDDLNDLINQYDDYDALKWHYDDDFDSCRNDYFAEKNLFTYNTSISYYPYESVDTYVEYNPESGESIHAAEWEESGDLELSGVYIETEDELEKVKEDFLESVSDDDIWMDETTRAFRSEKGY